ncbi:PRC-barrel domain-containing protein [Maritimibacter sp. 55A14]|uniref:PRC-barrel domain-containing protein n=1 Tax=Maritimibacter sp. 55A14 TaxID=2174844 RepID=UPI0011B289AD|nr:PRC-barrel domain-containing protein [Maritimibacter sp. 55A14]
MKRLMATTAIIAMAAMPVFADSHMSSESGAQTNMQEGADAATDEGAATSADAATEGDAGMDEGASTSADAATEGDAGMDEGAEGSAQSQADAGASGDESMSVSDVSSLTAEELEGVSVYDFNDERIGEINTLQLNDDGMIEQVIIDIGGFLGLGEKPVAVPLEQLNISREEGADGTMGRLRVTVDATEEELKSMERWEG